jgi:two-component system, LuxR family, sensor kinase FixL
MTLDIFAFQQVEGTVGKEDAVLAYFQAHESDPGVSKLTGDITSDSPLSALGDGVFGAFLRSSPDPFVICTETGIVAHLNPAAERLFGYNAGEIRGHKFASLLMPVPPDDLAMSQKYWRETARHGNLKARKKSGEIFSVDLVRSDLHADGETVYVVAVRDTSCKQRLKQRVEELQRELLHLSRYTVLGELASGITHELNQPLAAITAYAAAARYAGAAGEGEFQENLELLDKVAAQATRCGQIIHKLRRLVGDRNIDRVYDDLCATVQEAVQLAGLTAARHNVEIELSLPPQPVIVLMDRVQIHILITNLVKNAIDELANWRHERKIKVALKLTAPDKAELTVSDTGPGIAPFAFESIFDPFHTTKPDGLGMGLALSRRIAEAHCGRLSAANRRGGGAVFCLMIPVENSERWGNDEIAFRSSSR